MYLNFAIFVLYNLKSPLLFEQLLFAADRQPHRQRSSSNFGTRKRFGRRDGRKHEAQVQRLPHRRSGLEGNEGQHLVSYFRFSTL